MPDVVADPETDSGPELARLVGLHAAVVFVPVLVLGLLVGLGVVAVALALVVAAALTAWRLREIDGRIRTALGARPAAADAFPRLHGVVDNVAMSAGIEPFDLHVIDSDARNALIWRGLSGPTSFAITTGLLDSVDRIELEAVVGHHAVVARDQAVDVISVGALLFGPFAKGPLTDPIARHLGAAFDDRAVVLADLEGVRATAYPPGLVAALERVDAATTELPAVPPALTGLCLAAPHGADDPFARHPSLADRIDLLREM